MKTIDDRIIKYLLGFLPERGKIQFEYDLKNSVELKNELQTAKAKLEEVTSYQLDANNDTYFQNLLPRIHAKLNKTKSFSLSSFIKIAAPALAVVLITVSILFFTGNNNMIMDFSNIREVINNTMTEKDSYQRLITEIESDPTNLDYFSQSGNSTFTEINEYRFSNEEYSGNLWTTSEMETLSEEEINKLLLKLDDYNL